MKKLVIIILSSLLLLGCGASSKISYVEVPKIEKEYIVKNDTTIVRDSVFVDRYVKSDTVFLTKYKEKYVLKIKTDTLSRCDTLTQVKEVKVDVPYVPNYYHRVSVGFWVLLCLILCFVGFKIYIKFK